MSRGTTFVDRPLEEALSKDVGQGNEEKEEVTEEVVPVVSQLLRHSWSSSRPRLLGHMPQLQKSLSKGEVKEVKADADAADEEDVSPSECRSKVRRRQGSMTRTSLDLRRCHGSGGGRGEAGRWEFEKGQHHQQQQHKQNDHQSRRNGRTMHSAKPNQCLNI
ncbi:uncharacterized protein Dyak_GE27588 [Drosophila yakuba]|uniref:Uncharacterized protein n=1 Tax=Drosophila yakuba TaxID=7245 RepID=A0A0R1DRF5_DROYA|nr:uncharacterized protein Dyak_GE27588 [Drosophila yakuba]